MASETKLELCAYCGLEPGKTVDHIPPKLFFAPPYPTNLLTVPACTACNKSFQADDECTRFIISIDFRAQKNTAAQLKSLPYCGHSRDQNPEHSLGTCSVK